MSNLKYLLLLFACTFSFASHASVTVGICKPDSQSYPTITAAIAAAAPGEVINVCPGVYPEQLRITKPVSIRGIGDVTLVFPKGGLAPISAKSGTYTQVYVGQTPGKVEISSISIEGGDSFESPFDGDSGTIAGEPLCLSGYLENYSGVLSMGPAVLDHVKVMKHRLMPVTGGMRLTASHPYCGGGIEFHGDGGMVRNSMVDGFGSFGIRGVAMVEHNTIQGAGGAYSQGICESGTVAENTVTGPGFGTMGTTGIAASNSVKGNVVQGWATGIKGPIIRENNLIGNATGMSKVGEASGNMILAAATYPNLACAQPGAMCTDTLAASSVSATLPTVGVNVGCGDGASIERNRIEGVGVGFANVGGSEDVLRDNSLTGVVTASQACSR